MYYQLLQYLPSIHFGYIIRGPIEFEISMIMLPQCHHLPRYTVISIYYLNTDLQFVPPLGWPPETYVNEFEYVTTVINGPIQIGDYTNARVEKHIYYVLIGILVCMCVYKYKTK